MRKSRIKNGLRLGIFTLFMLAFSFTNAQTAPGDAGTSAGLVKDAGAGESIKVIDNKGTIKYLQSNNGITSITSTASGSATTTTWQLGGTLTDDTYITATGGVFAIDGIALITTEAASTDATTGSIHGTGTGYTLLVRDEATGATKKLLISDLIDVLWAEVTLASDKAANFTIAAAGMLATTDVKRVSVYRNGAKLRAGTDYEITTVDVVDIKVAEFVQAYTGDVFEVHFIK